MPHQMQPCERPDSFHARPQSVPAAQEAGALKWLEETLVAGLSADENAFGAVTLDEILASSKRRFAAQGNSNA